MTAPPLPPPQPRLRSDGTVKGPSQRTSVSVLGIGLVLFTASMAVLAPAFWDGINGPRFDVPGQRDLDLGTGTWTLYEHTFTPDGGTSLPDGRVVGFGPGSVSVVGPAPVDVWEHTFGAESITRGNRTYVGAVRFRIVQEGTYTVRVAGEPNVAGEVLVARPVSDLFRRWPWMIAASTGGVLTIAGAAMWIIGATNRRVARRAGYST